MSNEEVALRLLEKGVTLGCDSKLDSYFRIIDELENHSSILEEIRREKTKIEIAYEEDYQELTKEIERLNNIINEIKKLDLYISEEDYDYEENPIDKYIPFDIEDYIKELKGDSSNE